MTTAENAPRTSTTSTAMMRLEWVTAAPPPKKPTPTRTPRYNGGLGDVSPRRCRWWTAPDFYRVWMPRGAAQKDKPSPATPGCPRPHRPQIQAIDQNARGADARPGSGTSAPGPRHTGDKPPASPRPRARQTGPRWRTGARCTPPKNPHRGAPPGPGGMTGQGPSVELGGCPRDAPDAAARRHHCR